MDVVLSDVHTDCSFQIIEGSDYAVTRFKMMYPVANTYKSRKKGIVGLDVRRLSDTRSDSLISSTQYKDNLEGRVNEEFPVNITFDSDGDPVLDRGPFSANCARSKHMLPYKNSDDELVCKRKKKECTIYSSSYKEFDKCGRKKSCRTSQAGQDVTLDHVCLCCSKISSERGTKCSATGNLPEISDSTGRICCCTCETASLEDTSYVTAESHGTLPSPPNRTHNKKIVKDQDKHQVMVPEVQHPSMYFLNIKHCLSTDLDGVGRQVWNGSLLLCDFIIDKHAEFERKRVVEMGAGVGLCSILAAMYASSVYCTDVGQKVMSLAENNVSSAVTRPTLPRQVGTVHVKELDWFQGLQTSPTVNCTAANHLSEEDVTNILNCEILLAADVIYDFDITDAFFNTVKQIMTHPPDKTLYVSLEKRLIFTVEDLDVTSPAYNHFCVKLEELSRKETSSHTGTCFKVEQLATDFPQSFQYTRNKQMELWKVSSLTKSSLQKASAKDT